jgi:hypothetical protein
MELGIESLQLPFAVHVSLEALDPNEELPAELVSGREEMGC